MPVPVYYANKFNSEALSFSFAHFAHMRLTNYAIIRTAKKEYFCYPRGRGGRTHIFNRYHPELTTPYHLVLCQNDESFPSFGMDRNGSRTPPSLFLHPRDDDAEGRADEDLGL